MNAGKTPYVLELDVREESIWEMEETRPKGEFVRTCVEPCGQRKQAKCHGRERKYFLQWYFGGI